MFPMLAGSHRLAVSGMDRSRFAQPFQSLSSPGLFDSLLCKFPRGQSNRIGEIRFKLERGCEIRDRRIVLCLLEVSQIVVVIRGGIVFPGLKLYCPVVVFMARR